MYQQIVDETGCAMPREEWCVFELPVHPLATVNGMMTDAELDDLADSIAASSLHHPLVVYEGHLLDGRNRREACRRAGIVPDVVELDPSKDPIAFVLSENNNRRHRTEGARAMAIALLDQIVSHGGRREKGHSQQVFSKNLLSQISKARLVIAEAPDLIEDVKNGGSLNAAYEVARLRRRERDEAQRHLDALRRDHPNYAALVERGDWTLGKALDVVYRERCAERQHDLLRQQQDALSRLIEAPEQSQVFDGRPATSTDADGDERTVMLGTLSSIKGQLAELKARRVAAGWWQEAYAQDVQAEARAIIASVKAIIKAHQPLSAKEEVRRMAEQDQVRLRRSLRRGFSHDPGRMPGL